MTRIGMVLIAGALLFFGGCASDGNGDGSALAELGAHCQRDGDCAQGSCLDEVCSIPRCEDGECESCDNLMDCDTHFLCDDGLCVFNGDCEAWFQGWFVNADGECEKGGKSGCNNPFEFHSNKECEASLNTEVLTECPEDSEVFFGTGERPTAAKDLRCEYGEECCCGECHPSLVCHADAGQQFGCYATDACMIPGCSCETDAECDMQDACKDNMCQNACAFVRCAAGYVCEHGDCTPGETCTAYWEGAEFIEGQCVAQSGSGCSHPFTYESVAECCDSNEGARGCDQKGDTACRDDADCGEGMVCEQDRSNTMVCVSGCRDDSDCDDGQRCNTNIQCVTVPCPPLCE